MIIKSVQDIKHSNLARLINKYKDLDKHSLTVGIHQKDNKTYPDSNVTTAQVGLIHEFGLGNVEPRIWLRIFDLFTDEQKDLQVQLVNAFKDGKTVEQALNEIGGYMADRIRDRILSNEVTPPSFNKSGITLVDTGQLVNSIDYEVK